MSETKQTFGKMVAAAREARGWSQDDLAKEARTTQSTVDRVEKGAVLFSRAAPAIAAVLDLVLPSPGGRPSHPPAQAQRDARLERLPMTARSGVDDVPVYPAVEGGDGAMLIDREPIDWIPRPEPLMGVADGYAAYITGTSMIPAYRPGERAIVHPKLPIVADETYVFYTNDPSDDRALVKHLVRITPDEWIVEQYNPHKEFALDRREWPKAHRITGKYTRR